MKSPLCSSMLVLSSALLFLIAGCIQEPTDPGTGPFSIQVVPMYMGDVIIGQRCVFLVTVVEEGWIDGGDDAVNISVIISGAAVAVEPRTITAGQVAEVTVIPDEVTVAGTPVSPVEGEDEIVVPFEPTAGRRKTITGIIVAERGGSKQRKIISLNMSEGRDLLAPFATELRDKFIPWLETNHPELGITSDTDWVGTIVRPHIIGVSYYLFFSEDWEMGMWWNVMVPPHDWARIYLRHRFAETVPSHAFEISSRGTEGEVPHAIDPPDSVWR